MRAHYDPATQRIHLGDRPSCLYALCHERAHQQQHEQRTRAWRILERTRRWPYVCRLANLAVEIEAAAHALTILHRLRLLQARHLATASIGILSYVFSLIDPRNARIDEK